MSRSSISGEWASNLRDVKVYVKNLEGCKCGKSVRVDLLRDGKVIATRRISKLLYNQTYLAKFTNVRRTTLTARAFIGDSTLYSGVHPQP